MNTTFEELAEKIEKLDRVRKETLLLQIALEVATGGTIYAARFKEQLDARLISQGVLERPAKLDDATEDKIREILLGLAGIESPWRVRMISLGRFIDAATRAGIEHPVKSLTRHLPCKLQTPLGETISFTLTKIWKDRAIRCELMAGE